MNWSKLEAVNLRLRKPCCSFLLRWPVGGEWADNQSLIYLSRFLEQEEKSELWCQFSARDRHFYERVIMRLHPYGFRLWVHVSRFPFQQVCESWLLGGRRISPKLLDLWQTRLWFLNRTMRTNACLKYLMFRRRTAANGRVKLLYIHNSSRGGVGFSFSCATFNYCVKVFFRNLFLFSKWRPTLSTVRLTCKLFAPP